MKYKEIIMHKVQRFCNVLLSSILLSSFLPTSIAAEETAVYLWQKKRLLTPAESIVQDEKEKQKVFIYEGLTIADVEKALDQHFDRVEHMMFVSTILPPAANGTVRREEDGCD